MRPRSLGSKANPMHLHNIIQSGYCQANELKEAEKLKDIFSFTDKSKKKRSKEETAPFTKWKQSILVLAI